MSDDIRIVNGKKCGGPLVCPRPCAECGPHDNQTVKLGLGHHFGDSYLGFASDEPDHPAAKAGLEAWYGCKHCDAWHEDPDGDVEDTDGSATNEPGSVNLIGHDGTLHILVTFPDGSISSLAVAPEDVFALAAQCCAIAFGRMLADGMTGDEILERLMDEVERATEEGARRAVEMQA